MRIDYLQAPNLALLFLPLIIGYNGHGIFGTLFWMILWAVFRQAIIMHRMRTRLEDKRIILNSLPVSHYVEKVRWCLDKAGLSYEEEKDVGIFGILFLGRSVPVLNLPGKNVSIGNSAEILQFLYGHVKSIDEEKAKFLEHTPESAQMEEKIDNMGRYVRTWVYYHLSFANKNAEELTLNLWGLNEDGIPPWQRTALKVSFPILKKFLFNGLKIEKENTETQLKKAEAFFEETDKILNKNNFLLGTDQPTYIDYAFASLAALMVIPDNYANGVLSTPTMPKINNFPLEAQKQIKKFRNTPSGKFVLRMYEEHRS